MNGNQKVVINIIASCYTKHTYLMSESSAIYTTVLMLSHWQYGSVRTSCLMLCLSSLCTMSCQIQTNCERRQDTFDIFINVDYIKVQVLGF